MHTLKITTEGLDEWSQIGDQQVFVSDLIDQAGQPDARMTVGYARVGKGESLEVSFPYDEVLVVTRGIFTVRTAAGETITAGAGEAIYLPKESSSTYVAEEAAEMVYVANPPEVYAAHVAQAAVTA
jgi:ethanolamine utilization protein EutQ (cupin superfamily)